MLVKEIIGKINGEIPESLQESWDNCGLQLGDQDQNVERILVALEVTDEVIDEALESQCQMIVTHHPFFFAPIKRLDFQSFRGRLAKRLIDHEIAVYSAHTNFDQMPFGVSDALGEWMGLSNRRILQRVAGIKGYKLSTYVPGTHAKDVLSAMMEAGAGTLGKYTHCSFSTEGIGTFRALHGAKPFLGEVDNLAEFKEMKVEVMVTDANKDRVVEAMLAAHPYEVAAYDLFLMKNAVAEFGYGSVGELNESMALSTYADQMAKKFGCPVMIHGDQNREVQTISCCGGDGADLIPLAAAKSDLYLTGDIRASRAQMAIEAGLPLLVVPHYKTEKPGVIRFAQLLESWFDELQIVQTKQDDLVQTSWTTPFAES